MASFRYKGLDRKGKPAVGLRDAENPRSLRIALKREGIFATEIVEASERSSPENRASGFRREIDLQKFFERVRPQDIAAMTRQLATLLRAGIPLVEALQGLTDQASTEVLRHALADIRAKVNEGRAFGDSLAEYPKIFTDLYVNMIRAGETAGNLEDVLSKLADLLDRQTQLRSKVMSAMLYPAIIMGVGVIMGGFLMAVVVPTVTQIFADVDTALPWYTRLVIAISDLIGGYWWLLLGLSIGLWRLFVRWRRGDRGRGIWDGWLLRFWVVGPLVRMIAITRFSRTLGTMLGSGVPLLRSLEIVKAVLGNRVLTNVVDQASVAIREGESIAAPLARSGHFPPIVTRMIAVGERSGQLETMLDHVAAAYEVETDLRLTRLTTLLEPLMILLMGVVVGFMVFAILMPILQMNEMIG